MDTYPASHPLGPADTGKTEAVKALGAQLGPRLLHCSSESAEDTADNTTKDKEVFVNWATKYPAQCMILATQINWSMGVDKALRSDDSSGALKTLLASLEWKLEVMAETVLSELPADSRKKFEQMITELVHQGDV